MPGKKPSSRSERRRVCVVTGTRAEFGLLVPVMDAIKKRKSLELLVVAAGAHFLKPAQTIREVEAKYTVAARVPMQMQGKTGRDADAAALGRGVEGFARAFRKLKPDWVVVLGDRIEAFAAASAASIAGIAVCHIHGGDRAEGIADEAMRHAITKLSHLHCAATKLSAERIKKMGEKPEHVHLTGSPALDGLSSVRPMSDTELHALGDPGAVLLMHPAGLADDAEEMLWGALAAITARRAARNGAVLWLDPNYDPGRQALIAGIQTARPADGWIRMSHLPRLKFIALLHALTRRGGALVGNSSSGLIEAMATGIRVYDLGPRQRGRESHPNVCRIDNPADTSMLWRQIERDRRLPPWRASSRILLDGTTGPRIAALLAKTDPHNPGLLRKRNSY